MSNTSTSSNIQKTTFLISMVTCLVFCIALLALLACLPIPSLLSYLGYTDSITLANPENIDDPFTSYMVGQLVKNGTLISLKDVWSFQASFYQTIITFLIAINAIIAAISVIYIKSTSEEKAEETTKKYMNSNSFMHELNEKVIAEAELQLTVVKADFSDTAAIFEKSSEAVSEALNRLEFLEKENKTLRQQVRIISERIAALDTTETESKNNQLVKKEE